MTAVQRRDGSTVEDPRLGRLPAFDPASRNYPIRALLEDPARNKQLRRSAGYKWWLPGPTLDQGYEGQCVSEACHDARNGTPNRTRPTVTEYGDRNAFYHECQHADWWAGCYLGARCPIQPDAANAYGGTSVLAGAQLGKQKGWWSEYRWLGAGSGLLEADLIDTLRTVGGVVFGIKWLEGMYETSPSGLVEVSGREVGGHAIHGWEWAPRQRMPKHWSGEKPGVWWHNSWGPQSPAPATSGYGVTRRGVTGCGFILLDDLLALLEDGGEGMVPLP